jgi:multicomponent K+:H+ antiporter subunit D
MNALLQWLLPHGVIAPIVIPMFTAAVMLLLDEKRRQLRAALNVLSGTLVLGSAIALLVWVDRHGLLVYRPGNWPSPFGIVLVADRLSALMLVLASVIALCAVIFASARWNKAGVHFNALAQLQLMGLSGAFLTGDLFNLFVFFEILLAASYGLLLHGSGRPRVSASVHYVAINLAASSLFLLGASMLYGVTGTLNLADLSSRVDQVAPEDIGLLYAAAGILSVAFLVKAGMWPLNFWLVPGYTAATAPAAGYFAILTKVGVYALLRMSTLLFSSGPSAHFGFDVLVLFGLVTVGLGALGMIGSQRLGALAGFSLMISSGTLVAAIGLGQWELTGAALFYLVSSTLAASAFFLLIDPIERWRNLNATVDDVAPFLSASLEAEEGVNLDDEEERLIARPFPASTAFLGFAFLLCTLLIAGLPPLSSFVGKFAMLSAALGSGAVVSQGAWLFFGVVLTAGLLSLIAMTRAGIRHFWSADREPARVRRAEGVPIGLLLLACIGLTVLAGPALRYTRDTARALSEPGPYIDAVLSAGREGANR